MDIILLKYMCRDLVNLVVDYVPMNDLQYLIIEGKNMVIRWNRFCEDFQKMRYYELFTNNENSRRLRINGCLYNIRHKYLQSIENYKQLTDLGGNPNRKIYDRFKQFIYDNVKWFSTEKQLRKRVNYYDNSQRILKQISRDYYHFNYNNQLFFNNERNEIREAQQEWIKHLLNEDSFNLYEILGNTFEYCGVNRELRTLDTDLTTSKYYDENHPSYTFL